MTRNRVHLFGTTSQRALWRDDRGSMLPLMAGLMLALVGTSALGVEILTWYVAKRELQRVVDSAAVQGIYVYANATGSDETAKRTTALKRANSFAVKNGASGTGNDGAMTCSTTSGTTGVLAICSDGGNLSSSFILATVGGTSQTRIQVDAKQIHQNMLGQMFTETTVIGTNGAAALVDTTSSSACILGLASTGVSVNLNGNPTVELDGCSVKSNGDLDTGGSSALLNVDGVYADSNITGNGQIASDADVKSGAFVDETADPYASYDYFSQCTAGTFTGRPQFDVANNTTTNFSPGYYLQTSSSKILGTANLTAGAYFIKGDVTVGSQGSINGLSAGVTLIICGNIDASGTAGISIVAPTTGTYAGVAIAANGTGTSKINGGSGTGADQNSINGLIYVPNGSLDFAGHADTGSADQCLQIVANTVTISGTSDFANDCTGYSNMQTIDASVNKVSLVY